MVRFSGKNVVNGLTFTVIGLSLTLIHSFNKCRHRSSSPHTRSTFGYSRFGCDFFLFFLCFFFLSVTIVKRFRCSMLWIIFNGDFLLEQWNCYDDYFFFFIIIYIRIMKNRSKLTDHFIYCDEQNKWKINQIVPRSPVVFYSSFFFFLIWRAYETS